MLYNLMYIFLFLAPQQDVTISYNKLHADPKQGKSLDIGKILNIFTYNHSASKVICKHMSDL